MVERLIKPMCIMDNELDTSLERVDIINDLGILMDEKLSFKEHINNKINKAYIMLGLIKRNFNYLTVPTFILLYKNMVRS